MKLKKFICLLISTVILVGGIPITAPAFSSETTAVSYPVLNLSPENYNAQEEDLSYVTDVEELREYLLKFIMKAQSSIDLSSFDIPQSLYTKLNDLIWYGMPEAFNADGISFSLLDGMISDINISYRSFADTEQEYKKCFNEFKEAADRLLVGIEGNDSLSDVYKALLIHDRLGVLTDYCYTDITDMQHTAYSALVKGSAVCQGYSMAYMYLLRRVGIENYYCASQRLDHAWNIVYIDGKPYHVDVTWDDINWGTTGEGVSGGISHENFLRSTDGIYAAEHKAFDYDASPSDTKYDNYFWQASDTEFQLIGGKLYYINNKTGKLICHTDKKELADVEGVWYREQSSYWTGNFSRLSSAGSKLFYSLYDGVYRYDTASGKTKRVYSPELESGFNIFGFTIENGYLICDINNEPPGGNSSGLYKTKVATELPAAVITGIEADATGLKTHYIGDSFSSGGLVVKAVYSDGSKKTVTKDLNFSGFSSVKAGTKTVTVIYKDFSAQFKVKINTPSVSFKDTEIKISDIETVTPVVTTKPAGQTLVWKSSSDAVIVKNGKIVGNKPGKAIVSAAFTYNGKTYRTQLTVKVSCSHSDITEYPEIPATVQSIGYTKGVYCNGCQKYISGHKEIPKLELTFKNSEKAISDGKNIKAVAGVDASYLLSLAPEGSYIKDASGKVQTSTKACTGLTVVFPDKSEYAVVVPGDVDGDGNLTSFDARLALRVSVGLENYTTASPYYIAARVESENIISTTDARSILRGVVGLDSPEKWLR